jgi:hypothetical protein
MKCISLYQPWATLLATGAKQYETRSWPTKHRGEMAIHAGKRWTPRMARQCKQEPFASLLWREGFELEPETWGLPFGAVIAVGLLVSCRPTEELLREIGPEERAFGDFSHGRWAWEYREVIPLERPIPFRGMQGHFRGSR